MEIKPKIPYGLCQARERGRNKYPFYNTPYSKIRRIIQDISPVRTDESIKIFRKYSTGRKIIVSSSN